MSALRRKPETFGIGRLFLRCMLIQASLLFFCGCMHPNHNSRTPYQKSGFAGGYREKAKGNNTYVVRFTKNSFADPSDAYSSLLFRCLEIADRDSQTYIIIRDHGRSLLPVDNVYATVELRNTHTGDLFVYRTDELHKHLKPWMQQNSLKRQVRGVE
jgi:hypothetical protein